MLALPEVQGFPGSKASRGPRLPEVQGLEAWLLTAVEKGGPVIMSGSR
jgi:hypothetical protein